MLSKLALSSISVICFLVFAYVAIPTVVSAQVMINEVLADPQASSDKSEWLELYNYSDVTVDLTGWDIDGKVLASSSQLNLAAGQFLIVTKDIDAFTIEFGTLPNLVSLDFSFANTGDSIKLSNQGQEIDHFDYSSTTPNKSWERRAHDCTLVDLNAEGNSLNQLNPKQNSACSILPVESPPITTSMALQISELFPAPNTSVGETEWLELYNYGDSAINLQGWKLADGTKSMTLTAISISAHSYSLISDLKISLNNDGEEIALSAPDGQVVDRFKYASTAKQQSQIRLLEGTKYEAEIKPTLTPTPNALNVYTPEPPKVEPAPRPKPVSISTDDTAKSDISVILPTKENQWMLPSTEIITQQTPDNPETSQVIFRLKLSKLVLGLGLVISIGYAWRTKLTAEYIKWWKSG